MEGEGGGGGVFHIMDLHKNRDDGGGGLCQYIWYANPVYNHNLLTFKILTYSLVICWYME